MLGWTVLLLWADQDPLARKGVLLITVFPVILGIVGTEIYSVASGFIPLGKMVPTWALQILLISLFSASYLNAVRYERKDQYAV
jgi:amino acid transporter